jgi:hypothetical protein
MARQIGAGPRVIGVVGAAVGAAGGGALGWWIGYYGVVAPLDSDLGGLLFLLAFLLLPFGLIAPMTVFYYLRRFFEDPIWRWGLTIGGNVAMVGLAAGLAYFGVFQAMGVDTAVEAAAVFDAVAVATLGTFYVGRRATRLSARLLADDGEELADATDSWDELEDDDGW